MERLLSENEKCMYFSFGTFNMFASAWFILLNVSSKVQRNGTNICWPHAAVCKCEAIEAITVFVKFFDAKIATFTYMHTSGFTAVKSNVLSFFACEQTLLFVSGFVKKLDLFTCMSDVYSSSGFYCIRKHDVKFVEKY